MASSAYHITAVFRRVMDAPRPDWPLELVDRVGAIADVVDALFPDLTAAWRPAQAGGVARESRRRLIEVIVDAPTPARAAAAVKAVRELVVELDSELGLGPITLLVAPLESVEVIGA